MGSADSIASIHRAEMKRLKRFGAATLLRPVFAVLCATFFFVLGYLAFTTPDSAMLDVQRGRVALLRSGSPHLQRLAVAQHSYETWLLSRATAGEVLAFDSLSARLFDAVYSEGRSAGSFVERSLAFCSGALLRIVFLVLGCWRLWAFVLVGMFVWKWNEHRSYVADDVLGQTGNGRLFFSGIRAALENVQEDGAPGKQVVGLACPKSVSESELGRTPLAQLLHEFGIRSATCRSLAAVIAAYPEWPAYVARPDEDAELRAVFSGGSLLDGTTEILRRALELRNQYATRVDGAIEDFRDPALFSGTEGAIPLSAYAVQLKHAMHRVLTPAMRARIGNCDRELVATVVLAYQAGKVMAYAHEGERWTRKSNFSQLTARAVLHSIPDFGREFRNEQRKTIRRALIYGSRSSVFGPVRFAADLTDLSRALRQWVEVLMACPHELDAVSDDVELFGLATEGQQRWAAIIFDRLVEAANREKPELYATDTNLLFVPLACALEISRECLPAPALQRLKELQALVSQKQQLRNASARVGESDSVKAGVPAYERVFSPLGKKAIKRLAAEHGVPEDALQDWSAFRVVLNAAGWLARRVGDYSVPESSLIFAVLRGVRGDEPLNELGLLGKPGMIPFRGTRFEERWGPDWTTTFVPARSANMAETREHFEKLMKGILDEPSDSEDEFATAIG